MYAPLAGALLLAQGDCCAGGYCKIPAHHHGKPSLGAEQKATEPSSEAACEHEHSGMTECTMSCCKDKTQAALMPVAFVLPTVGVEPQPCETLRALPAVSAVAISRLEPPLSPPPRVPVAL